MRLSRSTNEYRCKSEEDCTLRYNPIEKVRQVLGRITSPQHEVLNEPCLRINPWQVEESRGVPREHRDYRLFSCRPAFFYHPSPSLGYAGGLAAESLPREEGQQHRTNANDERGRARPRRRANWAMPAGSAGPFAAGGRGQGQGSPPLAEPLLVIRQPNQRQKTHVSYSNTTTQCKQRDCHSLMGQQFHRLSDE